MMPTEYTLIGKKISRYEFQLTDCCNAIHSSVCGTGDRLEASRALIMYNFLICRLRDWSKGSTVYESYDNAMKKLCEATIIEYVTSNHLEQDIDDHNDNETKDNTSPGSAYRNRRKVNKR
jgi:hypothetical protein